jgi:hypothetical protein
MFSGELAVIALIEQMILATKESPAWKRNKNILRLLILLPLSSFFSKIILTSFDFGGKGERRMIIYDVS